MSETITVGHVLCRTTITSPVADEVGMTPNLQCGERVAVNLPADYPLAGSWVVQGRCPLGHQFFAGPKDLEP